VKVAYILQSFPNVSETFILDEIISALSQGVDCRVLSLNRPASQPTHADAEALLQEGRVTYFSRPGTCRKLALAAGRASRQPIQTLQTLGWAALSGKRRWLRTNALALARQLEHLRVDRIHAHFAYDAAQYALAVHRCTGLPFTVTTHHGDIFLYPPDNYTELAEYSEGIICVSQYNRRFIAEHFGVPLDKLKLVRCGVRTHIFSEGPRRRPASDSRRVSLLCVARLTPIKGHRYLLHAVRLLGQEGLHPELVLAGDGPERAALAERCRRFGIAESVRFLGFRTHSQVLDLYKSSDIFVLSSLSEGIPVSLMEAMACRVPVVATAVRGIPELVEHQTTGLLCRPKDPQCLAKAVKWILAHPREVRTMTRRARAKVVEEFDREKNTARLIGLWKEASS